MSTRTEPLATPRLELEPLRVAHAGEMAEVLQEDQAELRARYARQVAGPDWHNWILRLRANGAAAGYVQATVTAAEAELAWVVGAPDRGSMLAAEAATVAAAWLAREGATCFVAHIAPVNRASQRVALELGMTPGRVREDGEIRWTAQPDARFHPCEGKARLGAAPAGGMTPRGTCT